MLEILFCKDRIVSDTPTRLPLADLKPKMQFTGTVKKIELFGAFVDIGAERDGLVHISALRAERVNQVSDVLKEGDSITVWVRKVEPASGRIDLTMIEPLKLDWNELRPGQVYTGKVVKVEKFGAFVDIGAERPGMVHISELAGYRVEEVTEIVKQGEEIQVKVIGVNPGKKQIRLSLKALEVSLDEVNDAEEGEPMTAIEIALKRAMQSQTENAAGRNTPKSSKQKRQAQEDILSRTLANRRK